MSKLSSLQNQLNRRNTEIGDLRKELRELKEQGGDGGLCLQVDYLQQKNDELSAANVKLNSVNARLTEDAQRHFDARKEAEAAANTWAAETAYWKARYEELREEVSLYRDRLKQDMSTQTRLMKEVSAANAQILALQAQVEELSRRPALDELGRDINKPSAVSKRFKYLEFE